MSDRGSRHLDRDDLGTRAARSAIVVVPARDEAELIGGCLTALAAQTVAADVVEVVLVADACRDTTEEIARERASQLGLTLRVLQGQGAGVGAARRLGMDTAARLLLQAGAPNGLVASTDADSRPEPDWIERQLDYLAAGAQVVAGMIELDPAEAEALSAAALARRQRDARRRLDAVRTLEPDAGHHHFAGASIGISARVYRAVGGLEPLPALEDAAFAARLRDHGIPILRARDVRVRTSARAVGRVPRGLSVDLAVSRWLERRRYRSDAFSVEELVRLKRGRSVSVIVPVKQCADTISEVLGRTVAPLLDAAVVDELVVIDAGSEDGTAERAAAAGACVLQQNAVLPERGPAQGKGDAMWRALSATSGELVAFLDGDTRDPDPRHLQGLLGPLLLDASLALVKGTFDRPLQAGSSELAHEGGRVTELMARPLLNLHVPLLAGFTQPLAGEFAATRALLERLPFPTGYGVEIATLIDALEECGLDALAECELGERRNRHQPLRDLGAMAYAVLAAVERRIGPRSPVGGHLLQPWHDALTLSVPVDERPPLVTLRATSAALAA